MNNTLISTIRFGAVLGVALFAFVGEVFAAPTLTPVTVTISGKTNASFYAKVSAPSWGSMPVWFEYGDTPAPATAVGNASVYSQGGTFLPFIARVENLTPGKTYYVHAVAIEGGVTVQSPDVAFTVPGTTATVAPVTTTTTTPVSGTTTVVNNPVPTQTVIITSNTKTAPVASNTTIKNTTPTATKTVEKEETGTQGAAVIAAGDSVLPQTLIGWIALILALLTIMLMAVMIVETSQNRRFAHEMELQRMRGMDEDESEKH